MYTCGYLEAGGGGVAARVARTATATGRAKLGIYLPAELRDQLAREGFERGVPVSTLLEEGARLVLDGAKGTTLDTLRANWADMGSTGWTAGSATCPADPDGALLRVKAEGGRWRWRVEAAGAVMEGAEPLRSATAAMLEAEAAATGLTAEAIAADAKPTGRRRRRG